YLTVFIGNKGPLDRRLHAFEKAVRKVYASTYNDSARAYRAKRGLPDTDERMSVVVQRMIGREHQHLMYPAIAGVAFSRNFYPWSPDIRRDEGLVRLVFGLGTRAVGRNYARVVSLSHPTLRPEGHVLRDIERYSQEVFDALNLRTDELESLRVQAVAHLDPDLRELSSVARSDDYILEEVVLPQRGDRMILTFNRLLGSNAPLPFVELMRTLLGNLEEVCGLPIDIEFAMNMPRPNTLRPATFYLLQMRPLGVRAPHRKIRIPEPPPERVVLTGRRTMGNGHLRRIRNIVYVRPERYLADPAGVTVRHIGEINLQLEEEGYVLIGPGRWGTRNEQLGVPVLYSHISNARVLVEVSLAGFTPELSYGTHFFGDLFADDVPYIPVFPERRDRFNRDWLENAPGQDFGAAVRWIRLEEGVGVVVDGSRSHALIYIAEPDGVPSGS
ncbi:MAG: PEP/pyruvate-binding domain-containing protein, partial [Candidatus Krumholzibacteriia bacterium]